MRRSESSRRERRIVKVAWWREVGMAEPDHVCRGKEEAWYIHLLNEMANSQSAATRRPARGAMAEVGVNECRTEGSRAAGSEGMFERMAASRKQQGRRRGRREGRGRDVEEREWRG